MAGALRWRYGLENRGRTGVGRSLFYVRSPGEVLSLSPVPPLTRPRRVRSEPIGFFPHAAGGSFWCPARRPPPRVHLLITSVSGPAGFSGLAGTRSRFTTFIRPADRYAMGKKKAGNGSACRDCSPFLDIPRRSLLNLYVDCLCFVASEILEL